MIFNVIFVFLNCGSPVPVSLLTARKGTLSTVFVQFICVAVCHQV